MLPDDEGPAVPAGPLHPGGDLAPAVVDGRSDVHGQDVSVACVWRQRLVRRHVRHVVAHVQRTPLVDRLPVRPQAQLDGPALPELRVARPHGVGVAGQDRTGQRRNHVPVLVRVPVRPHGAQEGHNLLVNIPGRRIAALGLAEVPVRVQLRGHVEEVRLLGPERAVQGARPQQQGHGHLVVVVPVPVRLPHVEGDIRREVVDVDLDGASQLRPVVPPCCAEEAALELEGATRLEAVAYSPCRCSPRGP
mmetsp:Transcript_114190/g.333849  ORF Transcript_114190/g.333849 Transcript_114190/m.333849 type:complete len:248 (-) Transcript_114190:95-838(-)